MAQHTRRQQVAGTHAGGRRLTAEVRQQEPRHEPVACAVLINDAGDIPFVTLRGRFGGSALAATAVNALAGDALTNAPPP